MKGHALFGVAGNPPNFWQSDFRNERANSPQWLKTIGLDALEIQCTYGVRMPEERSRAFRENAKLYGIRLSIHAPYYITLGSSNPKKAENSINELRKATELANRIGSDRIIFHPGSIENDRKTALARAIRTLRRFEQETDLNGVHVFPEIAGKIGQLGSLEEILAMCEAVECAWPCLDLAHLHARNHGSLRTEDDFARVIDAVETRLGEEALKHLHVHLYPVEWGPRGEVAHKETSLFETVGDQHGFYHPRYEPFLEVIVKRRLSPRIICEAKDSQDIGALAMKNFYTSLMSQPSVLGAK
jgi:deoxyribonuclease-4